MKCLLLLVILSISAQASSAGRWQGIKQRIAPLSKKIAGGFVTGAVGATLLVAPLSSIDAHDKYGYDKDFREAAKATNAALGLDTPAEQVLVAELPQQLYRDMQILRKAANLELLGTFGVFDVELVPLYDVIIDRYELRLQLRRESSNLSAYFDATLGLAVDMQYSTVSAWARNLKGQLPSPEMIPSSLENLYLKVRADLWRLTDQYVLQVISRDDYSAKKDDLLAQATKEIEARKRRRIRNMTRTSRFGGYRK